MIPLENVPWIRASAHHIDFSDYYGTSGYIKAVRAEPGPAMHIGYGWSEGFTSADEAINALGDLAPAGFEPWPGTRTGMWGIWHPVNRGYDGSERRSRNERRRSTCDSCFIELPESGICSNCDD